MVEVPKNIESMICGRIRRDLTPSFSVVAVKNWTALLLGGGLSMIVCGQFGMGGSSAAIEFNHFLFRQLGPVGCTLVCGALFSVMPIIVLRILCTAIQYRVMIRKTIVAQAAGLVTVALLFGLFGANGADPLNVLIWIVTAFVAFKAWGAFLDWIENILWKFRGGCFGK